MRTCFRYRKVNRINKDNTYQTTHIYYHKFAKNTIPKTRKNNTISPTLLLGINKDLKIRGHKKTGPNVNRIEMRTCFRDRKVNRINKDNTYQTTHIYYHKFAKNTIPKIPKNHIIYPMLILGINTALKETEICLVDGTKTIAQESWVSQNDEAEKLMPSIKKLLKASKKTFEDLEAIFVIKGPGSFTGLRIGVTAANALSYMLQIPLYTMDTFQYLWALHGAHGSLILYAGRKEIYLQKDPDSRPILLKIEESKKEIKKANNLFGMLHEFQEPEFEYKKAKQDLSKILTKLDIKKLKKEKIVKPNYVKGPGISAPKPIK